MTLGKLKPFVPRPVWNAARRSVTYARRLLTWRSVLKQMSGARQADQQTLEQSARAAFNTALRKLDEWQDPQLHRDATVTVHDIGQFHVRALTDDLYHVLPAREPEILGLIQSRLSKGDLFVDAGANIGFYTVAASQKVGAAGKVVAVEMMPDTAAILRRHCELNGLDNVEVVERALSDRSGQLVRASMPIGKHGQASIAREAAAADVDSDTIEVETITLDEILAGERRPVALIKLDLEGAERAALQGAREMLQRTGALIFEQLGDDRQVFQLLQQAGFECRRLDANNWVAERP